VNTFKKATVMVAGTAALVMAGAGGASASSGAEGGAVNSPGVASGNNIQAPIHIPVNVCGNSVDVLIGVLNPTVGNVCANVDGAGGDHDLAKGENGMGGMGGGGTRY
jgi:hypothetical protein